MMVIFKMAPNSLVSRATAFFLLASCLQVADAQYYKISTPDEIRSSAKDLAYDLLLQYKGNQSGEIPGILPGPPTEHKGDYYWWQGGAMMGTLIDYWHYTGDTQYNALVTQGMLHQTGDDKNFMPLNHTASLGNDDQGFWGMSAMLAAENKFPDPEEGKPQWLALAQAVFNTMAAPNRHDDTCGGGLRWQVPPTNAGYNYKNTIANGCFFNIGARLARYTRNETYALHAEKTWDWMWSVSYIDHETWQVYDGGHVEHNCTDVNKATFSYNAAVLLQGAAFMYNYTDGAQIWRDRIEKMVASTLQNFFPDNIAFEVPCEGTPGGCTADMLSFKGYVARWLSVVTQVAPFTSEIIRPVLRTSAEAAVKQCIGGTSGRRCGFYWGKGTYLDTAIDKTSGAGEAMDVLAAVSTLLIDSAPAPATNSTGGTSQGNPNAGGKIHFKNELAPITGGDRAGAGILTAMLLSGLGGAMWWMSFD